ncbi:rhamnulokinase [Gaoshiqia sediminis]|uniref:Rhamnulokinase n=1 Tax=Gaoshiqia sediminis TaxID=2986998 RepID=A0AA41YAH2_9BACT|nr:rhamnulokinase family protein [Gaoshiqia sediminis]MCW0484691.1 rhamnulokinase [Gaoshiqia sediminis]
MTTHHFLAFDLGASSGRAILGTLENQKLSLTEVHRFTNQMQRVHGHDFWNIFSLFEELKTGLKKCISDFKIQPESIAVDTWGVDFVHLDNNGQILSLPFAYRDSRTNTAMEDLFRLLPKEEVYRQTGIQFMQFNSLFQLFSMVRDKSPLLKITDRILFMPNALNYLFSGEAKTEFSIASTSQMIVPGACKWQTPLLEKAGIPTSILGDIILPGQQIGSLTEEVARETGSTQIPVIAVAGHDTASAIASVPAENDNFAYISSGTWSIFGIETPQPIISKQTAAMNFTNEGGVEGTTRFLKNIMGMWLIQECRRTWAKETDYSWMEMVELARNSEPFKYLIDPDDSNFLNPGDMPAAITAFCEETGQGRPATHAEIIRCIYDSLALKYRFTLDQIRSVSDRPIDKIHIIGGGANNHFLNQLTANVTGLPVVAGPTEATATGNILMQAKALGYLRTLADIREVVRESFEVTVFSPETGGEWDKAYQTFCNL